MPSTPRMIEIERKASQPGGPALTREEVAEWHRQLVCDGMTGPTKTFGYSWKMIVDYTAQNRYLDGQMPKK